MSCANGGLILDTHIFMWWLADEPSLTPAFRRRIQAADDLYVSAASYWEIAAKHRIGKLPDGPLYLLSSDDLARVGIASIAIEAEDARGAGLLDWEHRDPFDRILVWQAQHRTLDLLTNDAMIRRWLARHARST